MRILVQDLVNLTVVERGVEATGEPLGTASGATRGDLGDAPQGRLDASRREAHRTRKFGIEEQKFCDAFRPEVGRVAPAVRLERRTRPKESDPFEVVGR